MVKGDRYTDGRLWVNGELTWPDQDLEFVAHGASEPTRSKFQSLWHIMTSDWHWPAQIAKAAVALMIVTLIPGPTDCCHMAQAGRGWDTIGVALRIALESRHGGR